MYGLSWFAFLPFFYLGVEAKVHPPPHGPQGLYRLTPVPLTHSHTVLLAAPPKRRNMPALGPLHLLSSLLLGMLPTPRYLENASPPFFGLYSDVLLPGKPLPI